MSQGYRVVIETFDLKDDGINSRQIIKSQAISEPKSLEQLGFNHKEQIELLHQIQDILISNQSELIQTETECPKCRAKTNSSGNVPSNFHAVFTDHKIKIRRRICRECGWQSKSTVFKLFGSSSHPDLMKLQCELGANMSFKEAESRLTQQCCGYRRANNHNNIKEVTHKVGETLSTKKQAPISESKIKSPSPKELVLQIDGGHLKDKAVDKRSFEALAMKIYAPKNVIRMDKNHTRIKEKSCVASALDDNQRSMKKLALYAAKQQGMTEETTVIALADGAKNCWRVTSYLKKHCASITEILDWFHIALKFQPLISALKEEQSDLAEHAKWRIWHGDLKIGLEKLSALKQAVDNRQHRYKIEDLYRYLNENKSKIVDYSARKKSGLIFTSHIAESTVEHLINRRAKKNQKMQWTREGAHNVLQIRASQASNDWDNIWDEVWPELGSYGYR